MQGDLFGTPEKPLTELEAAFWVFHIENPRIYELFDKYTRYAVRKGRTKFGVSVIIEQIRWYTTIVTESADGFKINNDHRAYYARLWMRNNPGHAGLFRTRKTKGVSAALAVSADEDDC
jgi:myosin-crossreactive antigen